MTLELRDITLTYPDGDSRMTALDHVNLTCRRGELTAVVGPSGSGKSSLLAVAATLITPDSGSVALDGTELFAASPAQRTKVRLDKIGIVFQTSNLISSLTAVEQLTVIAHLGGGKPARARKEAMELLDAVGLADKANRRPHQLSGGQRQRVTIARALMGSPSLLLVDEPTSALDSQASAVVLDLLSELTRQRNVATVMVTHDRSQLRVADQVATVLDGRVSMESVLVR